MDSLWIVVVGSFVVMVVALSGCYGGWSALVTTPKAEATSNNNAKPPSIRLTQDAVNAIREIPEETIKAESLHVSVGVRAGGTEGFLHQLGLQTGAEKDEQVGESNGIRIVTLKRHAQMLDGTTIDFVEHNGRRGFTFDNPNFQGEDAKKWIEALKREKEGTAE